MVKLGDAWRLARVYHSTYMTVLDEKLRQGMQYHANESFIYCAHPYYGPCEEDFGLIYQIAEGECPACLRDKGLPRKIIARQEVMDGVLPLLTSDFLQPSQAVLEYVAQLAILAKHMVARKIPNVVIRGTMAHQVVREIRAELFCRCVDAHWMGHGVADCDCFVEDHGYCANLGRHLRQREAGRILEFHRGIITPYVNMPDPDDDWQLILARDQVVDWFTSRRAARFDKVAIAQFSINPGEDQRYQECIQRLEAAVIKYTDILRLARGRDREPDHGLERNLRARAVFLLKPLQWVAYDTGLADSLVEEISEMVIHWYLRVGTPVSPPVDNAAWSAPLRLRRDVDDVRKDMQATMERLDTVFSTNTPDGYRLFRRSFKEPPSREETEVDEARRARAVLTAAAETRLTRGQNTADESVISAEAARTLWPGDGDDHECPLCNHAFADDPKTRRPVVVCERNHLVCRRCTVTHVVTADASLLEHDPEKLARCPMCRGSMARFYRATFDPAERALRPSGPQAAAPVVWD